MGTEMAEDEVEALLEQIALAKRKELRLRVEKKRIRDEMAQLQAETLWSREEQTQKQLQDVRREKEQLEAQRKTEEETLAQLSGNLKEQELRFRKGMSTKASPFQHAAASVVTNSPQSTEKWNQKEHTNVHTEMAAIDTASSFPDTLKSSPSPPPDRYPDGARVPHSNQHPSTQEVDALQHLIRNLNCDEQQKRIEKLQAELERANSRRQDADFDMTSVKVARRSAESLTPNLYREGFLEDSLPPGSKLLDGSRQKFIHLKPLDGSHSSHLQGAQSPPPKIAHPVGNVAVPPTKPAVLPSAPSPEYSQQFVLPSYLQSYPAPTAPFAAYPIFAPPALPINPYGMGFPSPYHPGCGYPVAPPRLPPGVSSPYQVGIVSLREPSPNPALQHQEEEIRRLERDLEMQRVGNEQQAESKEFDRLRGRLKELQSKLSTLAVDDNESTDEIADDEKDDSVLKALKRQHLESLVKVRNERDLLEEQEKLEELKEQIQRRKEERKRELDHDDWVTRQKRELVALRLQRVIQNNDEKRSGARIDLQEESKEPYNPDSGFVLFWDFAVGVPAAENDLQITYAVFEGKIARTPFKVVAAKETKAVGPQHKRFSFLSSRHIKKIAATSDLRVIVEVASVAQNRAGGSRTPTSLGWAAFDVFKLTVEGNVDLTSGCFKLPVKQSAMPDPSKTVVLPPPIGECGDIQVCIRVVHGERAEEASRVLVDPEFHAARYQLLQ